MKLELKGLKMTWIGFLLSLIGAVVSGAGASNSNGVNVTYASPGGVISIIINVVSIILIIAGLSMLKDVSDHYRKARNYVIIQIIMAIVLVALVMGVVASSLTSSASTGLAGGVIVLVIIAVVVLAFFAILFYKHLLQGCEDTAVSVNDEKLTVKIRKLWRLFITGFVISIAGVIVLFIGLGVALNRALASLESAFDVMSIINRGVLPGAIILIVGAIIMLVFTILLLIRMGRLCLFDGEIIHKAESENSRNGENI